jgi:hypothetical protein
MRFIRSELAAMLRKHSMTHARRAALRLATSRLISRAESCLLRARGHQWISIRSGAPLPLPSPRCVDSRVRRRRRRPRADERRSLDARQSQRRRALNPDESAVSPINPIRTPDSRGFIVSDLISEMIPEGSIRLGRGGLVGRDRPPAASKDLLPADVRARRRVMSGQLFHRRGRGMQ